MEPGSVGIADISYMRDGYAVARIVRAGKIGGMWTVQPYNVDFYGDGEWKEPVRRKVCRWIPLGKFSPHDAAVKVRSMLEELHRTERNLREAYHASIEAIGKDTP